MRLSPAFNRNRNRPPRVWSSQCELSDHASMACNGSVPATLEREA